jgi:hypothetical protein
LTRLGIFQIKGVESGDIELIKSKCEKKHQKVHWIGVHSPGNEIHTPHFPCFASKISKIQILEEKMIGNIGFLSLVQ